MELIDSYYLSLNIKGKEGEPVITSLKRISRPGLRVYANRKELPRVLGGSRCSYNFNIERST